MSYFPFISVPDSEQTENTQLAMYKDVAWDFNLDKPILVNGEFKIVEGNEAIKVWCYKAILTPRYEYIIYTWDYGSELQELIGKAYSKDLTESEAGRYITEALSINPYITAVEVNSCSFNEDVLSANITVKTIYEGSVEINV